MTGSWTEATGRMFIRSGDPRHRCERLRKWVVGGTQQHLLSLENHLVILLNPFLSLGRLLDHLIIQFEQNCHTEPHGI